MSIDDGLVAALPGLAVLGLAGSEYSTARGASKLLESLSPAEYGELVKRNTNPASSMKVAKYLKNTRRNSKFAAGLGAALLTAGLLRSASNRHKRVL